MQHEQLAEWLIMYNGAYENGMQNTHQACLNEFEMKSIISFVKSWVAD